MRGSIYGIANGVQASSRKAPHIERRHSEPNWCAEVNRNGNNTKYYMYIIEQTAEVLARRFHTCDHTLMCIVDIEHTAQYDYNVYLGA